jgi:hypothetical protein
MQIQQSRQYIRVDDRGNIIRAYSTAFAAPVSGDILISDPTAQGHVCLCGEVNPQLVDASGIYLYRWTGTEVVRKSDAEMRAEADAVPKPPPVPSPAEQIAALQAQVAAQAERIAAQDAQQLAIMVGLAETYELMLGGADT